MPTNDEKLAGLLRDLQELETYLQGRGERTRTLSLQFSENAKKDVSNREFDLNQARMLDYQHGVWNDIANLVEKLIKKYQ